jgi:hypothetical protein
VLAASTAAVERELSTTAAVYTTSTHPSGNYSRDVISAVVSVQCTACLESIAIC